MAKEKTYTDQDLRLVNRRDVKHALTVFLGTDEFKAAVAAEVAAQLAAKAPTLTMIGHPGQDGTWIEHPHGTQI